MQLDKDNHDMSYYRILGDVSAQSTPPIYLIGCL